MTNTLKLTFAYQNSENTRTYSLGIAEEEIANVKDKVVDFEPSAAFRATFLDNEGNEFDKIKAASIVEYEETVLNIGGEE